MAFRAVSFLEKAVRITTAWARVVAEARVAYTITENITLSAQWRETAPQEPVPSSSSSSGSGNKTEIPTNPNCASSVATTDKVGQVRGPTQTTQYCGHHPLLVLLASPPNSLLDTTYTQNASGASAPEAFFFSVLLRAGPADRFYRPLWGGPARSAGGIFAGWPAPQAPAWPKSGRRCGG